MTQQPTFALKKDEKTSSLWRGLKGHFEQKIAELRMLNDGDQPEVETAKIRGKIAAYKQMMALDKDAPNVS